MEDRVFDPRPGQTKNNKIGICCLSANHAAFRNKSKTLLAQSNSNECYEVKWYGSFGLLLLRVSTLKLHSSSFIDMLLSWIYIKYFPLDVTQHSANQYCARRGWSWISLVMHCSIFHGEEEQFEDLITLVLHLHL